MSEWQPIETAPKDGSRYLIYTKADERWGAEYFVAEWNGNCHSPDGDVRGYGDDEATHWMPLPPPPLAP